MLNQLLLCFSALCLFAGAISSSPIDVKISAAQAKVKATPAAFGAYNDLAAALCRKGRDTDDPTIYARAHAAVERSLQLSPANFDARKLLVSVLLGEHDFTQALKLATELNHKVPDDIYGWALLVDANIALGNYSNAERQAQWILDLRPGSTLGFEKSAALRELFGDVPGAIEFIDESNRRTSPNDADQHAWLLTEKARLQLASGYLNEAEAQLKQVIALYPDSQLATKVLADVQMAREHYGEAAVLLGKRYERVPRAGNLYDQAQALEKAGHAEGASTLFKRFAAEAEAQTAKPYNANRDLVFFYIEQQHDPAAALTLAITLSAERHDYQSLDAYAWALFQNGKYAEAQTQMDRALAVGIRDPVFFCHASQIAAKANNALALAKYQKELATFGKSSCPVTQLVLETSR